MSIITMSNQLCRRSAGVALGCVVAGFPCRMLAQPVLHVATASPAAIELRWTNDPSGLVLESAASLAPPVGWVPVLSAPTANGDLRTLALPVGGEAQFFRLHRPGLTTILESSPAAGEAGVAVTRETIFRLSAPLAAGALLTTNQLFAEFAGRRVLSRTELSGDRRTATLFYLENLPAAARVRVTFQGDGLPDAQGRDLDPDGNGSPGGTRVLAFDTVGLAPVPGTAVAGHVYAAAKGAGGANVPLAGVTITVDGAEETLRTETDATGYFVLDPAPAGRFFVHVDGRTAVGSQWPDGAYYPFVGKAWEAAPGRTNNLAGGSGEIFLPFVSASTLQAVSATQPTTVTFPPAVLAANPALAGVSITVPANDLYADNGARGGRVGIAPVPADRLPEPLPPGLGFPLVITVQTDGPSNFDTPVPVQFPNLPDPVTGLRLAPGEKAWLWSFNHDTGRWEPQGTMTISADGQFAVSDPGVGIRQPGWHGLNPGTPPTYPAEPEPPTDDCDPGSLFKSWFEAQKAEFDCLLEFDIFTPELGLVLQGVSKAPDLAQSLVALIEAVQNGETAQGVGTAYQAASLIKDLMELSLDTAADENPIAKAYDITKCLANFAKEQMEFGCQLGQCLPIGTQSQKDMQQAFCEAMLDTLNDFLNATKAIDFALADNWGKLKMAMDEIAGYLAEGGAARGLAGPPRLANLTPDQRQAILDKANEALAIANQLAQFQTPATALQTSSQAFLAAYQQYLESVLSPLRSRLSGHPNSSFRLAYAGFEYRGRSTDLGAFELPVMAPETQYTFSLYNPELNVVAEVTAVSAARGQRTLIPDPVIKLPGLNDLSGDADGDGLTDLAEGVLGTRKDLQDSDGDGASDFAEVARGDNPLDGVALPLGVVGSLPLLGPARGVRVFGSEAYVATGSYGLALVDVTHPLRPVVTGQIDLPGDNRDVAVSRAHQIAGVVAWSETGLGSDYALHFVDVSDPLAPRLIQSLPIPATAIETRDGLFYVTVKDQLRIYDPASGLELGGTFVSGPTTGLGVPPGLTLVATEAGLDVFDASLPTPQLLGQLPGGLYRPGFFERVQLVLDGTVLYLGKGAGAVTVDLSDPHHPVYLGQPGIQPPPFHSLGLTGSGRMVGLTTFSSAAPQLSLYDVSDPSNVEKFLVSLPTLNRGRDAALLAGFALVADEKSGLTVMNITGLDAQAQAPAIAFDPATLDTDPARTGIQVVQGQPLVLSPRITDDVQMDHADLLVDNALAASTRAFPVVLDARPAGAAIAAGFETNLVLQIRSVDRSGNLAQTDPITLEVVPDTASPTTVLESPAANQIGFTGRTLAVRFSEALDPAALDPASVTLWNLGADGAVGGGDDTPVALSPPRILGATGLFDPLAPLESGRYRLIVQAGALKDTAGNPVAQDLNLDYTVLDASPATAVWVADADGRFADPANWLHHRVPDQEDVLIRRFGRQPLVTIDGKNLVKSVTSFSPITTTNGANFSVNGGWHAFEAVNALAGSLWLNQASVFEKPLTLAGGSIGASGPLETKDTLQVTKGSSLTFDGPDATLALGGAFAGLHFTLIAKDGAQIALPPLVNYTDLGDFNLFLAAGTAFRAQGAGSRITLPELLSAEGPVDWNVRSVPSIRFEATGGGVVEAPKLTALTGRTTINVVDPGSAVSLPLLRSITGPVSAFGSTVNVSPNTVLASDLLTNLTRCSVTLGAGSVMRGATIEIAEDATLRGAGTLEASVVNRGAILLDRVPGSLTVQGDLELTPTGVLDTTVGLGADHSLAASLSVQGAMTLGGTLKLTLAGGYTPAAGQQFAPATFANPPVGAFSQVDDSKLGTGLKAEALASPTSLEVNILAGP